VGFRTHFAANTPDGRTGEGAIILIGTAVCGDLKDLSRDLSNFAIPDAVGLRHASLVGLSLDFPDGAAEGNLPGFFIWMTHSTSGIVFATLRLVQTPNSGK
jgi:hypothetical protein